MKFLLLMLVFSLTVSMRAAPAPNLTLRNTVPLPGVKGRFDHFAIDLKGQRLFVAALGNNTLEIIDIPNAKRLHSITGLHKPTGVLYLTSANHIGVANGDDGTFRIFNGEDYKPVTTVKSLDDADNVRFDAKANRIYLGYGDGALAAIDPTTWKTLASIKLPAHPESFQLEPEGNRIFVNLPDSKQVAVVDRTKQTVSASWPMQKFQANFPMALDEPNHRLFVGCRSPARLIAFDTAAGKPITDLAISGDTDDLFYDPQSKSIYISCGEGFIDIVGQANPDKFERVNRIPTRTGARTSYFSADRREFYLAVPQHGSDSAELRIYSVAAQ
jgi:DNA-binding beta-propeller fold protein YncE